MVHIARAGKRLFCVALLLTMVACQSTEVDSTADEEAVSVETAEVDSGSLDGTQTISATTEALSEIDLMPEVNAEIMDIRVEEGDTVEEGDVLAVFDDTDLQNTVEQEQAAYERAKSTITMSEAGQRGAQATREQSEIALENSDHSINQAQEQYEQAQTNLEQSKENQGQNIEAAERSLETAERGLETAEREEDRNEQLFEGGQISEQEMEQAEDAVDDAEDSVAEAEEGLEETRQTYDIDSLESEVAQAESSMEEAEDSKRDLRASIDSSQASVDEAAGGIDDANAALEQARLAVELAEENLEDAVVRAPSSGKVLSILGDPGEMYSQQEALVTLGELDSMNVTASVTPNQLMMFEEGEDMDVRFPSLEEEVTGTITYVASSTDDNGMFPVEVQVENPDDTLRAGVHGEYLIEETYVEDGLLVPTEAVIDVDGKPSVFVVNEKKAELEPVEILREESELTAVESDMKPESSVVTQGQYFLEDGTNVEDVTEVEDNSSSNNEENNSEDENKDNGSDDDKQAFLSPFSTPLASEKLQNGGGGDIS